MGLYRAEGIVLRSRPFGEADKILVILTKEKGKTEAVAKGARRPRSRLVGAAQPFSYLKLLVFEGKSLDQLSQAEIIKSFGALRDDLLLMSYATYWMELLDIFLPMAEPNEEVFLFTLAGLVVLEKTIEPSILSMAFEMRLLYYLGYLPSLEDCARCGVKLDSEPLGFSPKEGGALCADCQRMVEIRPFPFSREGLELMSRLAVADIREVSKWRILPEIKGEVAKALLSFIEIRAEKPIRSLAFLQSILSLD